MEQARSGLVTRSMGKPGASPHETLAHNFSPCGLLPGSVRAPASRSHPPLNTAMARTNDPDSATAQFFINVKDNPRLDKSGASAGYCVFGKVVEGMDVVDKIVAVETDTQGQHQNVPVKDV